MQRFSGKLTEGAGRAARVTFRPLVAHTSSSMSTPVRFGQYTLIERMAVGGMAEVFLALRPGVEGFEKRVAIKRIRSHLSTEDAFIKMFLFEAKLAATLQHPNIVQIYDLGKLADSYYIAMEYVSGRDMSKVVPQAEKLGISYPLEYAMLVAADVLEGLAYAHEKVDDYGQPLNIIHRDVTPENIMVGWNGHVRILDFGVAKASSQTDPTRAGEIKGKLSYMSPEQAMGKILDHRTDLFTLGVVLYEWLTGYKLFTGENEMAVLKSIIDGRIYPPTYFRDDVPTGVEDIVMKALSKNRDDRYQSAKEMLFDVRQWLQVGADFTPTNVHLANFMKQIFADEIERERSMLASAKSYRARRTPPPVPRSTTEDLEPISPTAEAAESSPGSGGGVQPGDQVGRAKTPVKGQSVPALIVVEDDQAADAEPVRVRLPAADLARLREAAQRAGVSPEDVLADLLRSTVKYF